LIKNGHDLSRLTFSKMPSIAALQELLGKSFFCVMFLQPAAELSAHKQRSARTNHDKRSKLTIFICPQRQK